MTRLLHTVRDRDRDDAGMTLVELLITSTILAVLLGMVFVSMDLINNVSTNVTSQYQEFDQALPALAPFHLLLAAEVEPGPSLDTSTTPPTPVAVPNPNSYPQPDFAAIGNYSMTFYANIGTSRSNTVGCPTGQSCTSGGTTAGPAKVVAELLDSNGNSASYCSTAAPCILQVRLYLPTVGANGTPGAPTCPVVWGASDSTVLSRTCTWSTSYSLLADVQDVVNNPQAGQPIFTYTVLDPGGNYPVGCVTGTTGCSTYTDQAITLTPNMVQNLLMTGLNADGYPSDTQSLDPSNAQSCAPVSASYPTVGAACPLDNIQSVGIDLMVAKAGAGAGGTVENSLVVYRYAQSPGASTAPYQYSETQG